MCDYLTVLYKTDAIEAASKSPNKHKSAAMLAEESGVIYT